MSEPLQAAGPLSGAQARYRVLLVDDNVDSCELFQMALEASGHVVEIAHDGMSGLAKLASGEFDVAIVDIGLPLVDGYELARRARVELGERTPHLIAMTGYGRPEDREAARDAGFDVYLLKPVDISALSRCIDAWRRGDAEAAGDSAAASKSNGVSSRIERLR